MKRKYFYILLVGILAISAFAFSKISSGRYFEIAKSLELFAEAFKEVNEYYVDDVNPNQLINKGIDDMLSSLDPYTVYIPEERIEEVRTELSDQYAGIGAMTFYQKGRTFVDKISEGSPAMNKGLKVGDEIIAIGNIPIRDMDPEEIDILFRGQVNTNISLQVIRYGIKDPLVLTFAREKINISSVPTFNLLPGDIGYVKLSVFNANCGREVKNAVISLKEQGAKGIILDLRDNGGGLLVEAVNICNIFIPRGEEVVTTRGKIIDNNATYKTLSSPTDTEIPIAILVNSRSASASEIVAGTMQDYDRAVILGTKSYGKGLVQVFRPLSYNSQLKVTTAKYYTPSGRCIQALDYSHRNPDGSVGNIPDSLKQRYYTRNDRIVYDGGGVDPDLEIAEKGNSSIVDALVREKEVFHYATRFYYMHDSLAGPSEFKVDEKMSSEFISWLSTRPFEFNPEIQSEIEKFEQISKQEKYYKELQDNIINLKNELEKQKANDLNIYRNQLELELQKEIVKRYYFEKGLVESTLDNDEYIDQAVRILQDMNNYHRLLGF